MQNAETVLGVLRERGRKGSAVPMSCTDRCSTSILYLMAYGRIYANQGAMTPRA